MALSDLELLELVERAQDERQGPIGPQGVGIRSIEQPTADAVIIALTDGRTKELRLTAGPKGDPGEAGKPGQDGKPGPAGSPGRAGAAGIGVAGTPGRDGTSIDTAIVNADGNLLLGLTDGNVLNVGRVVGPPGATGAAGPTGLPGRAGRDGNTILSGTHAPSDDEGSEGDFWIDTSSPLFDFYAKGSSGWRKLTSLRAPQTNVGGQMTPAAGGGGSGGGSGGGELQNTATLPLANPSRYKQHGRALPPSDGLQSQKDLNEWVYSVLINFDADGSKISVGQIPPMPTEVGMLWFSTNEDELTLYIYVDDQSGWVPAAPPVSLDGINTAIANVDAELMKVNANIAMNKRDIDELRVDIEEGDFRPGLEQVLEQGNVADKDIVLTDGTDDLIDISPAEGRIVIASDADKKTPKITLAHFGDHEDGNRKAEIELDEDGKRLDFEMSGSVKDVHFRFGNDEKFIINHEGDAEFTGKVKVQPGTDGNEVVTYEQIASLAGEIDEIKDEKEKGEWKAELPSTGSEGGREVLVNAVGFPEVQGGSNMMQLKETGGADGFGQLSILIDPGYQDDENKALQGWLKDAAAECKADPDTFKDKYSFYCSQAEELGFAVRDQPIHSIEDPSLTTFKVKFYGKPDTPEKEESIVGVEFFQEGAEGHRPAPGKFFMEAYQSKADQETACNDAYTDCLTGDPTQDSKCLRDLDTCMQEAADGFKPVSDFGEATAIIFHKTDCKQPAVTHSFDEVRIGDSINITDKSTGHFIVAEIDAIQEIGEHIRFTIDTVSHSGGIIADNKCVVEFYNFNLTPNGPDLENYVKKTGDTMSGALEFFTEPGTTGYGVKLGRRSNGGPNLALHSDGRVDCYAPSFGTQHLVNRGYVDNEIKNQAAPARMGWTYTNSNVPGSGAFYYSGTSMKFSYTPKVGQKLSTLNGKWSLTPNTYFTVWEYNNSEWKVIKTGHVTEIEYVPNGLTMKHDELFSSAVLQKDGTIYYVTVGGFLS